MINVSVSEERRVSNFELLRQIPARYFNGHEASCWHTLMDELRMGEELPSGTKWLGLQDAPAGKGQHHAYLGGLVVHLLEMIELAKPLIEIVNSTAVSSLVSRLDFDETPVEPAKVYEADAVRVILMHDLHKAYQTFQLDNGRLQYIKDTQSAMMSNNAMSLFLITKYGLDYAANPMLMNALECSEGGWAKNHPYFCAPLAKLCYLLDELSANVVSKVVEHKRRPADCPPFF